jgi:hypothetical protein
VPKLPSGKGNCVTKCAKTIKVTQENYESIIELKAKLELQRKKPQIPNDAITYLFQNQKEQVKNEG